MQPTATAKTVRVRDSKTLTTDGPFAETKEQLGGFYLLEAASIDEAASLAAGIPLPVTDASKSGQSWSSPSLMPESPSGIATIFP